MSRTPGVAEMLYGLVIGDSGFGPKDKTGVPIGKLLRDYADGNSCLIFGPDSPTTNPYNTSATPDVLDIVITRDLPSSVYLTSCLH